MNEANLKTMVTPNNDEPIGNATAYSIQYLYNLLVDQGIKVESAREFISPPEYLGYLLDLYFE